MNFICFDLELNQPSGHIIQLGYVIFNPVRPSKVNLERRFYVALPDGEELSPEITQLTGIQPHHLEYAPTLVNVYSQFLEDIKRYQTFHKPLVWGTDHIHLRKELGLTWQDYVFPPNAIDVKAMYQALVASVGGLKTNVGVANALRQFDLDFIGRQHDALDDAINQMRVYLKLTQFFRGGYYQQEALSKEHLRLKLFDAAFDLKKRWSNVRT